MASAGGEVLVVAGYVDQGGRGIVQAAVDTGAFDTFYFPDGMVSPALLENHGSDIDGSYGANPGTDSPGAAAFEQMAADAGFEAGPFSAETYDAAALILLGHAGGRLFGQWRPQGEGHGGRQCAGRDRSSRVNWRRASRFSLNGGDIDYVGASAVELIGPGESAGNYRRGRIRRR